MLIQNSAEQLLPQMLQRETPHREELHYLLMKSCICYKIQQSAGRLPNNLQEMTNREVGSQNFVCILLLETKLATSPACTNTLTFLLCWFYKYTTHKVGNKPTNL